MYQICDLSHHNLFQDFEGIALDGAMIRLSYGKKEDLKHNEFASYFQNKKIPYGFYWYSRAINKKEMEGEAAFIASLMKKYGYENPSLPVAVDFEDADSDKKKRGYDIWKKSNIINNTDMLYIACRGIEAMGCYAMIYASDSVFQNCVLLDKIRTSYDLWVARYNTAQPVTSWGMWQYTDNYHNRHLDMSKTRKNYPEILENMYKKKRLDFIFNVGDIVKIKNSYDIYGTKLSDWVLDSDFKVEKVNERDCTVYHNGTAIARVPFENLKKV